MADAEDFTEGLAEGFSAKDNSWVKMRTGNRVERAKHAIVLDIWIMLGLYAGKLNRETYPPDHVRTKLADDLEELIKLVATPREGS